MRYAESRKWTVAGMFIDTGLPGASRDRPALNALLHRVERGADLQAVVVEELDRLSRDPDHLIGLYRPAGGGLKSPQAASVNEPGW